MESNDHEEVFIRSYARLRSWAIQIARQDHELAEDLLHDAFIQFTRAQPDLENVENTESYLYGVIRNLHLSHIRKKTRRDKYSGSVIDFETIGFGLTSGSFLDNLEAQEELRRICYFLCLRKETSKSASVMILRFFHGYFPSEISQVMRATTQVVKVRLNTARNEIKVVIENNEAIETIEKRFSAETVAEKSFRSKADLTNAFGKMIFRSTEGVCLEDDALREIYFGNGKIETKTLAHIVSCRKCIDKINALLGLLPISERYSVDFIGKDGGNPQNPTGNGGGMNEDLNEKVLLDWRRGSREVYEHEPRELLFSINGEIKATRKIESNQTEMLIEIGSGEPFEFIEIFSEQNVRLAFLSFTENAAETTAERQFTFQFSDQRNLSLNLKTENSQIILSAVYDDPQFEKIASLTESEDLSLADFLKAQQNPTSESELFGGFLESKKKDSLLEKIKNRFFPAFVGFNPAVAGGSFAAFIIAAVLIARLFVFVPDVSAVEIIQKAGNVEQTNENDGEKIVHRIINFEEKNPNGEIVRTRKIEYWNDAVRKLSTRRLYDENNRLIGGEWRRKDGVSTVYAVGKSSEIKLARSDKEIIFNDLDNIWQLSVSAKGFESMIDAPENTSVQQANNQYQISYSPKQSSAIIKAVLHINQNLRTDKLVLSVKQNDIQREFYFTETIFEQKPRETVEKAAFEPNAELIKNSSVVVKKGAETEIEKAENPATETEQKEVSSTVPASSTVATPEMEVKVLQLLSGVNALSGDQINIVKTADGKLQIRGIVDAKSRKDEILNALAEVRGNPAISVNILTAEEAAKNKSAKNGDTILESVSVESKNSIPAGDLLRKHFAARGLAEEKIEAEIRRFASGALAKSSQVRRSALQMKQIAERFSADELEKMDETTRNNWRKLLKQNAANLAQNSEVLRNEFRSVAGIDANGAGGNVNSSNDAELIRAAKRLFELSLAVDRDISASFSSSGAGKNNVAVSSAKFGANLSEIIGLAKELK